MAAPVQDENEFLAQLLDPKTQNQAFQRLVSLYQKPLYNLIRNIVNDHDDTHDVLQNTFVKVYRSLPRFKGESKLFSWMYRIATNEAITFLNSRNRRSQRTSSEYLEVQTEKLKADSYFDSDDLSVKLQKAVDTLPEKQALVFKLKYFEEMKYEEMSNALGTSVGALKASYFHAVKKIEEFMTRD